ncbi:MAG: CBS domain-containing protein [Patescibacteria group bacterium]|nr:CBS domain-containing protein [Patescibacteria group bacterium]
MTEQEKYLVKNNMQDVVTTVNINATFREALQKMVDGRTNGVVVVDDEKYVKGILSSMDLIQYVVPDYLEEDKHLASFEAAEEFSVRIKEVADEPITKFMTKEVHTIKESHTLMEAATMLSEFKIRQIPVVDAEEKLVGYINRTDIKKAIARVLGIH